MVERPTFEPTASSARLSFAADRRRFKEFCKNLKFSVDRLKTVWFSCSNMLKQADGKVKRKVTRRRVKYPRIGEAARDLGVRRESLWRALEGIWQIPKLVWRYELWKKAQAAKGAKL